nr:fibronectin type III domain-containing protein [Gemmatimonadota bacterium]
MRAVRRQFLPALTMISLGLLTACGDDPVGPEQLSAPSSVTVSATGPTAVSVSWTAVSGATSYSVERSVGASGDFSSAGTASTTSFTDSGLSPETDYRYRITATSGSLSSPPSTPATVRTRAPGSVTISADITSNRTFHADTVYQLSGFIKVANGATLTIQPGT